MGPDDIYKTMKAPPSGYSWTMFKRNVVFTDWVSCWLWVGPVDKDGYGKFGGSAGRNNIKRTAIASRRMAIWVYGTGGEAVDHVVCNNRACVNPLHLLPGTVKTNALRSNSNPTAINARKTHCKRGHELPTQRICFACKRIDQRNYYLRQKEKKHG